MQPQEIGTSKTITQLNGFLSGEMAAAATYRLALERLERSENRGTLVQCARSHEERARLLTTAILGRSGEPVEGFGVWVTLLRLVEKNSTVTIAEGAAVAALEEGENLSRDQYLEDLVGLEISARELIEFTIIPEQRRTHEAIMAVRRSLA